jgi:hypothetical protein
MTFLGIKGELLPQVKLRQYLFVLLGVLILEIFEEPTAPADKRKQAAARMEIILVLLEMLS